MAIIYKKGQKDLEYTGADKAMKSFGDTLEKIKTGVKKVVTRIPRAMEAKRKGDAVKELDNINRAFGDVKNYEKFSPESAPRNRKLEQTAYGTSTATELQPSKSMSNKRRVVKAK